MHHHEENHGHYNRLFAIGVVLNVVFVLVETVAGFGRSVKRAATCSSRFASIGLVIKSSIPALAAWARSSSPASAVSATMGAEADGPPGPLLAPVDRLPGVPATSGPDFY